MYTKRSPAVIAIATMIAISSLLPSSQALASTNDLTESSSDWLPTVPESSRLSAPPIVDGTISTSTGSLMTGARVVLYVWPGQEALNSMAVGASANLQPVAKTVTDSHGHYALRLASLSGTAAFGPQDGTLDLEIVAFGRDGAVASHSFSRRLGAAYQTQVVGQTGDGMLSLADTASVNFGAIPEKPGATRNSTDNPAFGSMNKYICGGPTLIATYYPKVVIGTVYTGWGNTGDFLFKSGSSSTLGVGISLVGSFGSFSSNGTVSRSDGAAQDFAPTYQDYSSQFLLTKFEYGMYRTQYCLDTPKPLKTVYEIRPISFGGGDYRQTASRPTVDWTYCVQELAGDHFYKYKDSNITWTNGVDLSPFIGLDLSTKTGYSTSAELTYAYQEAGYACGTNGHLPGSKYSYQVVAI